MTTPTQPVSNPPQITPAQRRKYEIAFLAWFGAVSFFAGYLFVGEFFGALAAGGMGLAAAYFFRHTSTGKQAWHRLKNAANDTKK